MQKRNRKVVREAGLSSLGGEEAETEEVCQNGTRMTRKPQMNADFIFLADVKC